MMKNAEKDDEKLIEDFLGGDDAAFERLVKRNLKPAYNFLYQLVRDQSVLDDLTQATFFKVWKNIQKFDRRKNFKTWLFAIAKNTAYDFFKKKKTVPFSYFEDSEGNNKLENIAEDKILPDEILAKADLAKLMEEKLDRLPSNYRIILILRYKEDFSLQEISEILKIPYNTAKSQHARALVSLKKILL